MPALSLALLVAVAGALPTPELAEPGERVTLRAELGELSVSENLVRAEGGAVLESGGLLLRAELLEYDLASREASASGQVLFVDGNIVALADEGDFSLQGERRLSLRNATVLNKGSPQAPADYLALDAPGASRRGQNALTLKAAEVERLQRSRFVARRLEMTSCDSDGGRCADWSLGAASADIELGERAVLRWPTFRVRGVPILVLPAIYVPLSSRRTGLLMTQVRWADNSLIVEQPFFLTLGRSYDLTFGAGYRWGFDAARPNGPRGSAEFRYAPAEPTSGRLFVAAMNDLHPVAAGGEPFGARGQGAWLHSTELSNGLGARVDLRLLSDARYLVDESTDFLKAQVPYVRTEARAAWRGEEALLSVSSSWYQTHNPELLGRFASTNPEQRLFGSKSPVGFQRPIALRLDVPSLRLFGPVRGGVEVAASHYRPVAPGGAVDEARLLRSFSPTPEDQRLPLTLSRLDLRPALSVALPGSGPVRAEAYAAARADLSSYAPAFGEGRRVDGLWGRAVAGVWAGTELSRRFGEGAEALHHTITPRLELRGSTRELGERPVFETDWMAPVDEYDFAHRTTTARLLQGIASVRTRLSRGAGELARLELGQGYDLAAGELSESFGELAFGPRWVSGRAGVRFDPVLGQFSQISAALQLADARGDAVIASYDWLLDSGTAQTRAGLDDLFGPPAGATVSRLQQLAVDATAIPFKGASLRYGITVRPDLAVEQRVLQHRFGLGVGEASDCWRLGLSAETHPVVGADGDAEWRWRVGFTLDLKNLGSLGS